MQKVILSLFCPLLVAIATRVVFVLLGISLFGIGYVYELGKGFLGTVEYNIAYFNTFIWDSSWPYWILVVILTFLSEMTIWEDNSDKLSPSLYKKFWYYCLSCICITIIIGILYCCIGWTIKYLGSLTPFSTSTIVIYGITSSIIGLPITIIYENDKKFWEDNFAQLPFTNFVIIILVGLIIESSNTPIWLLQSYIAYIVFYNITIIVCYTYNTTKYIIKKE